MQDDKINEDDFEDLDFDDFEEEDLDDLQEDEVSPLGEDGDELVAEDIGDDFPDDDDFADEDWADDDAVTGKSKGANKKGGATKLSSKIILPLAIGVVVIGAGGFYLMQNSGGSGPQQMPIDEMVSSGTGFDITEDSLPMPSPMASPVEEEFAPEYATDSQGELGVDSAAAPSLNADGMFDFAPYDPPQDPQAGTFTDNEVLTPMPGLQETGEATAVPLESLGLEEAPDDIRSDFEEPLSIADINANDNVVPDIDLDQDISLSEPPDLLSEESIQLSADVDISRTTDTDLGFDFSEQHNASPAIQQEPAQAAAPVTDITGYEERIESLEDNLNRKDEAISALNAEIEALKSELSSRESALEEAKRSLATLERSQSVAASSPPASDAPATTAKRPASPAAPAAKPATRTAEKTAIKPKWELRAAQPGRAFIGIIGSEDMQVVETGDTLQGIGRIESITMENGIWVVKGTNGTIKQ